MNKRRHQRIEVQNLVAKLLGGLACFSGIVNEVALSVCY